MNTRKWSMTLLALLAMAVVAGATSAVPAEACSSTTYVVRPGDTLYRISVTFGVRMDAIASANGIYNYNLIFVGQTLVIPCGGSVSYATSYVAPQYTAPRYVAPQRPAPPPQGQPQGFGIGNGQAFTVQAGGPNGAPPAMNGQGPGQPGANPMFGGGRP